MSYKPSIRKNWISSFELMAKRPILLLPFFIIAFLEGLALELLYFSTRQPLSFIAAPIIRKFSGEAVLHYPYNLLKLPKYFYYTQILIFIFAGVLLLAVSVNIFKNIKEGLPLKANALIKNAAKRYLSFVIFGVIVTVLIHFLGKFDKTVIMKLEHFTSGRIPQITREFYSLSLVLSLFVSNVMIQAFLVLTVPIMLIRNAPLVKALWGSICLGARHFFVIFPLVFLPSLIYLPIAVLKAYSPVITSKTFPEMGLIIVGAGVIVAVFVECFIIVCAAQFLMDKDKAAGKR